MVSMREIWEPIVLSSVLAFGASSVIWMVLGYHDDDATGVRDEEPLREALRRQQLAPGQYVVPHVKDPKARRSPEFLQKLAEGPLAFITVKAAGVPNMARTMGGWFFYLLVLNSVIAYAAGRTLPHGLSVLTVFRAVGGISWLAYGGAHAVYGIFWWRPWRAVWKDIFDAFVYACLNAGAFAWLWPR